MKRIYNINSYAPTLGTMQGGNIEPKILVNNDPIKIRKLTPKECWRLMGFIDNDFESARLYCSNTQLYKQAGNSIVVPVLEKIFINLFKEELENEKI